MAIQDPIYRVPTTSNVVYLTFDDGPYVADDKRSSTTHALLNVLENVRTYIDPAISATFFINGWTLVQNGVYDGWTPNATLPKARRGAAREILDLGHDIANHSHHHRNPWGTVDEKKNGCPTIAEMLVEIGLTRRAMNRIDPYGLSLYPGINLRYFRAPGDPSYWPLGNREQVSKAVTSAQPIFPNPGNNIDKHIWFKKCVYASSLAGYKYVSYNIMARDDGADGAPTVNDVFENCTVGSRGNKDKLSFDRLSTSDKKGAIILMHNGRLWTDKALPKVIRYIYGKGYVVRKLPDNL
jgi:peptidoglycan/xylan/chitin deacetylase (PgdA/CDA1 family)